MGVLLDCGSQDYFAPISFFVFSCVDGERDSSSSGNANDATSGGEIFSMVRVTTVFCQEFISIVFVLDEVGNLMFQDFFKDSKRTKNAGIQNQNIVANISKPQESFCVFAPSDFQMPEVKLFQGHSNIKVNFFLRGEHGEEKIG